MQERRLAGKPAGEPRSGETPRGEAQNTIQPKPLKPKPLATKTRGDEAESRALAWLQARGLRLLQRNYRVAGGPRQRGGEIDLVMQAPDGTLVFIEVRARASAAAGGAAASVSAQKQARLVRAAQHFLLRWPEPPPCRFDVLAIDGGQLQWLQAAFDAG